MPPPRSRQAAPRCSPSRARSLTEYWDYTHRIFEWPDGGYSNMILDDGGDATLLLHLGAKAEKDLAVISKPASEEEECLFAAIKAKLQGGSEVVFDAPRQDQGRHRGDHHRRQAPLPDGQGRPARVPGDQRQRLGHQEQVRQPLWLPRVAGRWHQARDRRDDRGQGRRGRRLRRCRQGFRAGAARAVGAGVGDRDRSDLRAAGGDGRLSRRDHGLRRRQGRHLRHRHRQFARDHARAHAGA